MEETKKYYVYPECDNYFIAGINEEVDPLCIEITKEEYEEGIKKLNENELETTDEIKEVMEEITDDITQVEEYEEV